MPPEPYAPTVEPVLAYAQRLANFQGVPWSVVTIPEGSLAWNMGGRYAAVPDNELPHYINRGAEFVQGVTPTA